MHGLFNVRIDVNACNCTRKLYGQKKRESALKVDSERKNPLPNQGIEPASAACQSHTLPTELRPHPSGKKAFTRTHLDDPADEALSHVDKLSGAGGH